MKTKLVVIAIGAALLIAPVSALAAGQQSASRPVTKATPLATQTTVNWQIPLSARPGFPRVTGSAQYQAQPGQRELQIEIEHLRSFAGRFLVMQVNGATVGSMKVSGHGIAQLTRNTERGQTVPMVVHGSIVTVKTTAGAVITSGRF
jgi:hypothetical protein